MLRGLAKRFDSAPRSMQYVITDVSETVNDWVAQGKYPMKEYRVHLDEGGRQYLNVEWSRKAESPAPVVGQKLDIERLEDRGARGLKLHLAQKMDGARPEDPLRQKRIVRQHSQNMAIQTIALALQHNMYLTRPEDGRELLEAIFKLADQFDADVERAAS